MNEYLVILFERMTPQYSQKDHGRLNYSKLNVTKSRLSLIAIKLDLNHE